MFFAYLSESRHVSVCRLIAGSQFIYSIVLFLHQLHAVFITIAPLFNLKSGRVILLPVILLFGIILDILSLFVFPYEF